MRALLQKALQFDEVVHSKQPPDFPALEPAEGVLQIMITVLSFVAICSQPFPSHTAYVVFGP